MIPSQFIDLNDNSIGWTMSPPEWLALGGILRDVEGEWIASFKKKPKEDFKLSLVKCNWHENDKYDEK